MSIGTALSSLGARIRAMNCRRSVRRTTRRSITRLAAVSSCIRKCSVLPGELRVKTAYYGYFKKGTCIGAVATWGSFIAGERYALRARKLVDRVDFGFPVLYLPVAQGRRCRIMFRARFLLDLQKRQIGWAFFPARKTMSS